MSPSAGSSTGRGAGAKGRARGGSRRGGTTGEGVKSAGPARQQLVFTHVHVHEV